MRKIFFIAILFASVAFARAKNNCAALQSANAFHADSSNTIKQFSRNTYQKEWDLVDTKLAVNFDWKLCRMPGLATLKLTPHFFSTDSLVLDAKGFDIKRVAEIIESDSINLIYKYDSVFLTIKFSQPKTKHDTITLFIDYTSKPNERSTKSGSAITSDKGLYFINPDGKNKSKPREVWTQGETESASCWFPTLDHPNQKTTATIFITREKKFVSLSNGEKLYSISNDDSTETDVWQMKKPHSPYLFMLAVSNFSVVKNYWRDSLEVNYYVDSAYHDFAEAIFGKTPQMIECFSKRLHYDFPWNKYSQVIAHDYVSGAMENTSATLHGEFVQKTDRELLDKNNEDVISHELFHQWFGDLATAKTWSDICLNEAFATYGEYIWFESAYSKATADAELENFLQSYLTESKRKTESIVRYNYKDPDDLFDRHTYQKGARVLHMLRNVVGDDAFFESLHQYLMTYQYSNAEVNQLKEVFEEVTGMNLTWFFDEWFFKPGHPKLNITCNFDLIGHEEKITIEQTQTSPSLFIFKFPLTIDVYADGAVKTYKVFVDKRVQEFSLICNSKPDLVNVDAEKILLCEKNENKTLPEYLYQYHHSKNYKDQLEALNAATLLQSDNFSARELLVSALRSPVESIRKFATENIYTSDSFSAVIAAPILQEMVADDNSAPIRAAAIRKLSVSKNANNYISTYQKVILDSSYTVCAEALKALGNTTPNVALSICKNFETEPNETVQRAVAHIYADKGTIEQYLYFTRILKTKRGTNLYPYINDFSNFLYRMPDPIIEKGTLLLSNMAQNDEEWQVRYAAYEAIKYFKTKYNSDIEKDRISVIDSILTEIKAKEKNPELKEIYANQKQ